MNYEECRRLKQSQKRIFINKNLNQLKFITRNFSNLQVPEIKEKSKQDEIVICSFNFSNTVAKWILRALKTAFKFMFTALT